jgi:hypothetical protein
MNSGLVSFRLALLGFLLLKGAFQIHAQATEPDAMGVWYIYFADYGLSEKWSVHHETHLHLFEPLNGFNRFVVRAGLNYNLKPDLTGSVFYHYSYSDPTFAEENVVNELIENRLMEQLVYRQKLRGWGFSHRIRTEQRYQDREGDTYWAYRARYRLLVNHKIAGPLYWSGDGEVLSEYQEKVNTSYRLSGSLGTYLNPNLRLQVGYTHFFLSGGGHDERLRVLLLFKTDAHKKES